MCVCDCACIDACVSTCLCSSIYLLQSLRMQEAWVGHGTRHGLQHWQNQGVKPAHRPNSYWTEWPRHLLCFSREGRAQGEGPCVLCALILPWALAWPVVLGFSYNIERDGYLQANLLSVACEGVEVLQGHRVVCLWSAPAWTRLQHPHHLPQPCPLITAHYQMEVVQPPLRSKSPTIHMGTGWLSTSWQVCFPLHPPVTGMTSKSNMKVKWSQAWNTWGRSTSCPPFITELRLNFAVKTTYYFKLAKVINLSQSLAILIICLRISWEKERDFFSLLCADEPPWQVASLLLQAGVLQTLQTQTEFYGLMDPGVRGWGWRTEKHRSIYITTGKIDGQWASAIWLRELQPGLCNNLQGWDGEGGGKEAQKEEDICTPMADSCWYMAEINTIL